MSSEATTNWEEVLNKLSSYKGTIKSFCKENNISAHQLYYRRKRAKKNDTPTFHAVSMKGKAVDTPIPSMPSKDSLPKTIEIEIGKAKISIPSYDQVTLTNIIKAIITSC
ncbi:hypothetical protein IRB23M11_09180 [Alkalibacterium sp. m-11]|uniref:Transposase n=1 Tax=Alkalibacterium indicireducens TaxID=398758 RepID=A0ABP3KGB8_9LACT